MVICARSVQENFHRGLRRGVTALWMISKSSWLTEKKTRMQYEILRLHVSFQGTDIMYL